MNPRFQRYLQSMRERLQGLWPLPEKEETPKVVWLRGETRRTGLDQRESHQQVALDWEFVHPSSFCLEMGCAHSEWIRQWGENLTRPIRRFWLERGFEFPPILLQPSDHLQPTEIAFGLFGLELRRVNLPLGPLAPKGDGWEIDRHGLWNPVEVLQLELACTVWQSLPRVVNRDYARNLAENHGLSVPPRTLGRLSKYLRAYWQSGLSLPCPSLWLDMAEGRVPLDNLGLSPQPALPRPTLTPEQRLELLLQAAPVECRGNRFPGGDVPYLLAVQAVEELVANSRRGRVLGKLDLACRHLAGRDPERATLKLIRSCLTWEPLAWYQESFRRNPETMERFVRSHSKASQVSYRACERLALVLKALEAQGDCVRACLEHYLGPMPQLTATESHVDALLTDFLLT